jgi:hypothetical protein
MLLLLPEQLLMQLLEQLQTRRKPLLMRQQLQLMQLQLQLMKPLLPLPTKLPQRKLLKVLLQQGLLQQASLQMEQI